MGEPTRADREEAAFRHYPHGWPEICPLARWIETGDQTVICDKVVVAHASGLAAARAEGAAAALADPGLVLGAAEKLLCCAVNDPTGLIATALQNGAVISLAIRNDEEGEARRG